MFLLLFMWVYCVYTNTCFCHIIHTEIYVVLPILAKHAYVCVLTSVSIHSEVLSALIVSRFFDLAVGMLLWLKVCFHWVPELFLSSLLVSTKLYMLSKSHGLNVLFLMLSDLFTLDEWNQFFFALAIDFSVSDSVFKNWDFGREKRV